MLKPPLVDTRLLVPDLLVASLPDGMSLVAALLVKPADTRLLAAVLPVAVVLIAVVLVAESLKNEMIDAAVPDAELLDMRLPDANPLDAEVPAAGMPDFEFLNARLLDAGLPEAVPREAVAARVADADAVLDVVFLDAMLADAVPPIS